MTREINRYVTQEAGPRKRYFPTLEAAQAYAEEVRRRTGAILGIELTRTAARIEAQLARHRARDPHCTCNDCIEWMERGAND